jgi:hypothetical protein
MHQLATLMALGLMAVAVGGGASPPTGLRPADDRTRLAGDIDVVEAHVRDFGYDPGPLDGRLTAEIQAAVRAYQARYGLPVSGRLDWATRLELVPGLDERGLMRSVDGHRGAEIP